MFSQVYKLRVRQVNEVCDFELTWGEGQTLSTELPYPAKLSQSYQRWQETYLQFYRQLRGKVVKRGQVSKPSEDWRSLLVQAEAELLDQFHYWLLSPELVAIRRQLATTAVKSSQPLMVCLTCTPLDLARLPWETWEIGTDLGAANSICLVRTPGNIAHEPVYPRRRKARVLAILGDDTGLEFEGDRTAVTSLSRLATVEFVGWTGKEDLQQLKHDICQAIADPRGWDVLFFAGHSNETALTGGELAIAPGVSLSIHDISESLHLAKTRGLQFAIFNSCSGLAIAQSLINLGLNQVAVMREPIHNRVAQEFLIQFIKRLTQFDTVYQALFQACHYLKQQEKRLTYPSAYLVPSLFTHPEAELFHIQPFGWREHLKQWIPNRWETATLATLTTLSCLFPLQTWLLNQRVGIQARYRHITQQIETTPTPSVVMLQIDNESIAKAGISSPVPMNRTYLAQLIGRLTELNVNVIGIDYLLDRPHQNLGNGSSDTILTDTLQTAVENQQTWFIFVSKRDPRQGWIGVLPEIADPNWSLQGRINIFKQGYMQLHIPQTPAIPLPFSYLLALSHSFTTHGDRNPPQPDLNSTQDFEQQILSYISQYPNPLPPTAQTSPITAFSYPLQQMWLHPIIDYSLPPSQVYSCLTAWQLLEQSNYGENRDDHYCQPPPNPETLANSVVIIAPGGYDEAGITPGGDNLSPPPAAFEYWTQQNLLTGGEVHGYMLHHLLKGRLVVPLPDLWIALVAALLAKGLTLMVGLTRSSVRGIAIALSIGTIVYGLLSLQAYISMAILLPWFFPTIMVWGFVFSQTIHNRE
ncbi:CHASE2 domain-containing protein [Roseofilum capinflatum]|uniref:CHASE2 domain-containing protein n=1 Tax=Roseofilum capinflatum BLCC-M114 TaxID=3022440 RepID=A0ABT7B992_9CYAN|nr:CHASE2 domain-containing protein [Roseofilum capinflatum]MDJ1175735.1 CHASE2 domain-containing protein [Roseofilum capinflatum BLCC-M114]